MAFKPKRTKPPTPKQPHPNRPPNPFVNKCIFIRSARFVCTPQSNLNKGTVHGVSDVNVSRCVIMSKTHANIPHVCIILVLQNISTIWTFYIVLYKLITLIATKFRHRLCTKRLKMNCCIDGRRYPNLYTSLPF